MNEREIKEVLSKQVVEQAEEKVKMTFWNFELLTELNNVLTDHFKNDQSKQHHYINF